MINAVVRIMSPDDDDERASTERVVMYLEPLLTAKNISLLKFEPKSVAELADVLAGLEEKAKVGLRPIIHLDMSADATGWGDVGAARLDSLLAPSSRRACASCARRRLAPGLAHSRALGREFPNAYQGIFPGAGNFRMRIVAVPHCFEQIATRCPLHPKADKTADAAVGPLSANLGL